MSGTHFVDIHVLGDPGLLPAAMEAVQAACASLHTAPDARMSAQISPVGCSGHPWPPGQGEASLRMAFDRVDGLVPDQDIQDLALKTGLCQPGVRLAAAVHWSFGRSTVRLWLATQEHSQPVRLIATTGLLERALGTSLEQAMETDAGADGIGDCLLPFLVRSGQVQSLLSPLHADHLASRMDNQLAPGSAASPRGRM